MRSMNMEAASLLQLNVYSELTGNLKAGNYYMTYFQFPSPTDIGVYESFTCTNKVYHSDITPQDYEVRNYKGE